MWKQSSAAEQINLMISAGEIPDVMQSIDANAYYQQGIIGGWSEEFFREHAPRLSAYIDETEPKSWGVREVRRRKHVLHPGVPPVQHGLPIRSSGARTGWKTWASPRFRKPWKKWRKFSTASPRKTRMATAWTTPMPSARRRLDAIYGAFGFQRNTWIEDGEGGVVFGDVMPAGQGRPCPAQQVVYRRRARSGVHHRRKPGRLLGHFARRS